MAAFETHHIDMEQCSTDHHHHRRSSFTGSDVSSCHSQFYSVTGGSYDEHSFPSCLSDADTDEASDSDRASSAAEERDCRICHMGLESSVYMELGCCCKDDLAFAHKQCAETWFKIKGNKICEICHSLARNLAGQNEIERPERTNGGTDSDHAAATGQVSTAVSNTNSETQGFWRGHRFLNFLLTCMVSAFVISWFFHFNLPSQR